MVVSSISKEKFNDYDGFVEKFKPKKTTDDCYTPDYIYDVVLNYVCDKYGVDKTKVVRPFYPDGDYEKFDYSGGKVVIDNPPFSIFSKILEFYIKNNIDFFLFAPSLTMLSGGKTVKKCNHIACNCSIVYENGATVKTSFVTSFGYPNVLEIGTELTKLINNKQKEMLKIDKTELPKYEYPNEVITAALCQKYAGRGIEFSITKDECEFIRTLDEQRQFKKSIFGGGPTA